MSPNFGGHDPESFGGRAPFSTTNSSKEKRLEVFGSGAGLCLRQQSSQVQKLFFLRQELINDSCFKQSSTVGYPVEFCGEQCLALFQTMNRDSGRTRCEKGHSVREKQAAHHFGSNTLILRSVSRCSSMEAWNK